MSEWYGLGQERLVHPLETWESFCGETMQKMRVYFDRGEGVESEWIDAIDLGKAMLTAYLEEYGEDEQWDFIATEKSGQVRIPSMNGSPEILYAYTFDAVYRDLNDGDFKLLETKTAAAIATGHLTLDDQAGSYWAVASNLLRRMNLLGEKERIAGINYNFLRKAMPDTRPRHPKTGEYTNKPTKEHYVSALKLYETDSKLGKMKLDELQDLCETKGLTVVGEVSKSQPPPVFLRHFVQRTSRERNAQIRRIAAEATHMQFVRDGILPVTKTPQSTGTNACQYGCEFFNMCELHEAGRDWEQYRDAMYRKRDMYADHRKEANG